MATTLKNRPPLPRPAEIAEEPGAPAARINPEFGPELAATPKGIYNTKHQSLSLGEKIGTGGEGSVYELQGQPEFVAKLYHEPPAPEKAAKLIALAKRGTERLHKMSAWPVDVLRDWPDGNVIGFVMRKIAQAEEVHTLHSPKSRLKKFPEASWAFLLHVATNIARAIAAMHEAGFVVGDVNPKNILVTRQATVYLLDCDSFQFADEGKLWRCEGGFPEYTPPELQGIPFSDVDRTQEHDCFGLAVVIFQLLFLGRHPYSGRYLGAGEMPLEKAIGEGRFAYGTDAATRQMQPPPGTLPLEALPTEMAALLRRAFLERDRPNPREWLAPLETFSQSLQRCKLHNGHHYFKELSACPWCEIEGRAGIRLFNFLFKAGPHGEPFQLQEMLSEVERLSQVQSLPAASLNTSTLLSPAAQQYRQTRNQRFWSALALAVVLGVVVGWSIPPSVAIWFILVAAFVTRHIVKSNPGKPLLFPHLRSSSATPSLAAATVERQKQAQNYLKRLEYQLWGDKEGEQGYFNRLKEIRGRLREYQNLSQRRADRLESAQVNLQRKALARHLKQQTFDDPRLAALTPEMKDWLRERGIHTAADLTSHRFKPSGDITQFQLLLNWRQELMTDFQRTAPQTLPPETRLAIEQELDKWKLRLETEVSNAVASLRAFKPRLEQKRSELLQPWIQTQRDIAQSEVDLRELRKENRVAPVIVTLVVAFLLGSAFFAPNNTQFILPNPVAGTGDTFNTYFNQGLRYISNANYEAAKDAFMSAMPFVSLTDWDARYASFYHNLCFAKSKLQEGPAYLAYLENQLKQHPARTGYRVQLIMLYALEQQTNYAIAHFQTLKISHPVIAADVRKEMRDHGVELEAPIP